VNKQTDQPLVEFIEGQTLFHSRYLEREMRTLGIPIPPGSRSLFNGQDTIYLGDDQFQKAFKEIYYETLMDRTLFKWE